MLASSCMILKPVTAAPNGAVRTRAAREENAA
jgi:hypothetical protein